ncbi:MAG: polysaccharide deacetylase family protein [Deltaproteobacteria bacterium]|nr:polysaccharide deacetylase family protein [Deltaproteobacteria bacterium]
MVLGWMKIIIGIVYVLFWNLYAGLLTMLNMAGPGTFVVLFYHGIPAQHRGRFARQMDVLLRCATPVRADFAGPIERGVRYVAVTFDDGFQSFADTALPELEKRGIPSTVFVPTAYMGKKPGWVSAAHGKGCNESVMSREQIIELASHPLVSVQSHGHRHVRLAGLGDAALGLELAQSKKILEALLGCTVTQVAFPFGSFNRQSLDSAARAGYERAFGILPGGGPCERGDLYMGRIFAQAQDARIDFKLKIAGAYRWLPYAVMIKNTLRRGFTSVLRAASAGTQRAPDQV